jgi:centromeric protein E
LEIVVRGYEDNLGEPLRAVREDVEKEWEVKVEEERKKREEAEAWAGEVVRALEKEKKVCGLLASFPLGHVMGLLMWFIVRR